jgi:hypothetical protein
MKRYILVAVLTALGWLGTANSVQAQIYYTYNPMTGAYVQAQTALPSGVVQVGNVSVSWTPRGYYDPGVVYYTPSYSTYYYPNGAYYYRPYRAWYGTGWYGRGWYRY